MVSAGVKITDKINLLDIKPLFLMISGLWLSSSFNDMENSCHR